MNFGTKMATTTTLESGRDTDASIQVVQELSASSSSLSASPHATAASGLNTTEEYFVLRGTGEEVSEREGMETEEGANESLGTVYDMQVMYLFMTQYVAVSLGSPMPTNAMTLYTHCVCVPIISVCRVVHTRKLSLSFSWALPLSFSHTLHLSYTRTHTCKHTPAYNNTHKNKKDLDLATEETPI